MSGKMRRSEASSSSSNSRGETVVVDCGRRKSSCGYCKSGGRTSISHGLWAHSITVDDYQDLLDRGWRRSGCFLYKPEMERTCCPSYTIRLKASDFLPSKEQLRVFKKMQRFLDGTLDVQNHLEVAESASISKSMCSCVCHEVSSSGIKDTPSGKIEKENREEHITDYLSNQVDNAVHACTESGEFPAGIQLPKASVMKVLPRKKKLQVEGAENLMYTTNIAFQITATIRRAQSTEKEVRHSMEDNASSPKIIAEKLTASLNLLAETNGLTIRACNGHINFYSATTQDRGEDAQIVTNLKGSATGCKRKGCCSINSSKNPQGKKRKLEIRLKRSSFDQEEFALYRRYQIKVHNDAPDHVTESSYRRFLVDTPLVSVPPSGDGRAPPCGFGSFHQQYIIDGQLIAVGVIDILPKCLSSKYLFWDPDFACLSLGKYSALQEIDWVNQNQVHCSSLQYYYLGYYIHSCSKMRYKAGYRPSELLCPVRYQWVPFDIARPLLDTKPYVVLSNYELLQTTDSLLPAASENVIQVQHNDNSNEDINYVLIDEDEEMIEPEFESSDEESGPETSDQALEIENGDVTNILIGLKGTRVRYEDLQRAFGPNERSYLETQLRRYKRVVGKELSERMVYSLG